MFDVNLSDQGSMELLGQGIHILNGYRFGYTDIDHVDKLLEMLQPPVGARVLDAGCGFGQIAHLMRQARPDLQFTLQNISSAQLDLCPDDMPQVCGDYADTGLPDASFDVVMFNYSICHAADWDAVLREAARLLPDGGILFINDHERVAGDNVLMSSLLRAMAFSHDDVVRAARRAGFELEMCWRPEVEERLLHRVMGGGELADLVLNDLEPAVWRFRRRRIEDPIESAIWRHEGSIGLQFSGGRDSVATLYKLRPYWDRLTVYHLDTGDQYPEAKAVVAQVAKEVPITVIRSDVKRFRDEVAWPADVVPVDNTLFGRRVSGRKLSLISRYDCCAENLMRPMHERMLADGITLIIRGQRDEDYFNPPKRSGDIEGGVEVLYPVESWSTADVDAYIAENQLPNAAYYAMGAAHGPECMGCTAWMDDNRIEFLERVYPENLKSLREKLQLINAEVQRQLAIDGRAPQKG